MKEKDEFLEALVSLLTEMGFKVNCKEICVEPEKEANYASTGYPSRTDYLCRIAEKIGLSNKATAIMFDTLNKINPGAVLSLFLREIALDLDSKYPDHIKDSKEIFGISPLNGKIIRLNKASIKNYNNFAAFRTVEDARIACRIMSKQLRSMFAEDVRE